MRSGSLPNPWTCAPARQLLLAWAGVIYVVVEIGRLQAGSRLMADCVLRTVEQFGGADEVVQVTY